ncbi:sugar ABC transporter substrate-binding protein [Paenibacillus sp. WQ 127069]|uniref:Sugar ABC transporter substrate-binding protein n=1 Tax=Paenibacillus baimaensis TaxID=2982185 RepID=A0ABT2UDU7_9BACL|nr:sugar ABC transporter substrate-binding protein [Paenibacillus sp. WQ 127069]MCU6792772.1 sugar ABC transporter substrate-binding protein [Paenibacillus sp. WQ 127069]
MSKGIKCSLIFILAIALLISGCSGNTQQVMDSKANQGAAPAAALKELPQPYGIQLKDMDGGGTLKGQYKGKKITLAVSSGSFENAIKAVAPYFEQVSGAKVEVQSIPGDNLMDKVQLDLNSSHIYDVVITPIAFIHGFAEGNQLKNLQPFVDNHSIASPNLDMADFIPSLLDIYGKYKGKLVAFPYKPDVQLFFYRKDLFEDPKIKAAYKEKNGNELKVPETPEEFVQTAKFFTKSLNPDSPVTYGYSTMASKGRSRWMWVNRLAYYGGNNVDGNFKPAFNNKAGLEAMNIMLELQKTAPKELLQFGWDEANNFFATGEVAMMEQWPGLFSVIQGDKSKVKDKVGFAVTPGQAPTLGGWAISMAETSKEAELAYKFIEYVTSKDAELLKMKDTMDPTRKSNYERQEVRDSQPFYPALLNSLKAAKILADTDVPFISAKLNDIQEVATQSVLNGQTTREEALQSMAKSFETEIGKLKLAK